MVAESSRAARRVGVRDVARLAGVSTQTVSRVLNEHASVRDETRRRVLDAMDELGFRVNNAARALGTRRSRTLGVIASDATLYGPSAAISALESAARRRALWIATAYADADDEASVDEALEHLLSQGVDGVILVAPHRETVAALRGRRLGVPVEAMHSGAGSVRQAEGAALAVDHLAALGHRRVARLGGPGDWVEEAARADGFRDAVARHGLECVGEWAGDWSAHAGSAVAADVAEAVRRPDGPTAVVVANDQMALGLIAGLHAAGLDVPGDVSVTGFDDNPDAAYYRPALTSVRVDVAGEAVRCVAGMLGVDADVAAAPPLLVARASTAAAAG